MEILPLSTIRRRNPVVLRLSKQRGRQSYRCFPSTDEIQADPPAIATDSTQDEVAAKDDKPEGDKTGGEPSNDDAAADASDGAKDGSPSGKEPEEADYPPIDPVSSSELGAWGMGDVDAKDADTTPPDAQGAESTKEADAGSDEPRPSNDTEDTSTEKEEVKGTEADGTAVATSTDTTTEST
jgi:hypothetical protein